VQKFSTTGFCIDDILRTAVCPHTKKHKLVKPKKGRLFLTIIIFFKRNDWYLSYKSYQFGNKPIFLISLLTSAYQLLEKPIWTRLGNQPWNTEARWSVSVIWALACVDWLTLTSGNDSKVKTRSTEHGGGKGDSLCELTAGLQHCGPGLCRGAQLSPAEPSRQPPPRFSCSSRRWHWLSKHKDLPAALESGLV